MLAFAMKKIKMIEVRVEERNAYLGRAGSDCGACWNDVFRRSPYRSA